MLVLRDLIFIWVLGLRDLNLYWVLVLRDLNSYWVLVLRDISFVDVSFKGFQIYLIQKEIVSVVFDFSLRDHK